MSSPIGQSVVVSAPGSSDITPDQLVEQSPLGSTKRRRCSQALDIPVVKHRLCVGCRAVDIVQPDKNGPEWVLHG